MVRRSRPEVGTWSTHRRRERLRQPRPHVATRVPVRTGTRYGHDRIAQTRLHGSLLPHARWRQCLDHGAWLIPRSMSRGNSRELPGPPRHGRHQTSRTPPSTPREHRLDDTCSAVATPADTAGRRLKPLSSSERAGSNPAPGTIAPDRIGRHEPPRGLSRVAGAVAHQMS